jgi:hypothetical protein
MATQRSNSPQRAVALLKQKKHIMFISWFTGQTQEGHWSMVVWHLKRNNKVCFYHFDSLNRFDDIAPYSLSDTPLNTPQTDSNYMPNRIRMWDVSLYSCIINSSTHRYFPEQGQEIEIHYQSELVLKTIRRLHRHNKAGNRGKTITNTQWIT